jgi:hypothetical protein
MSFLLARLSHAIRNSIPPLVLPTLFAHGLVTLALAFVPPNDTATRTATLVLAASACLQAIRVADHDSYEGESYSEYMFGMALHASCCLLLLRLQPPATAKTARAKLQWALNAFFSPRMGSPPTRTDPASTTKPQFLLRRLGVAASLCVLWHYLRAQAILPPYLGPADWAIGKDSMLPQLRSGTLTLRDLWFRVCIAFYMHASSVICLSVAHSVAALIAVGIFDSPHTSWPPLYGSLLEAYSLRRWYSHFWHLATRKALTLHAQLLASYIPGLRAKDSQTRRIAVVFLSFVVSGMMHAVTTWPTGPCGNWLALWIFPRAGLVIISEQVVQAAYKALHSRLGIPRTRYETLFWRMFGYCWVAFYWVELGTKPAYEQLHCESAGTVDWTS